MRLILLLALFGIFLQGCHSGAISQGIAPETAARPIAADTHCTGSEAPVVEQWLWQRDHLCQLSAVERKAEFQRIEQIQGGRTLGDHLKKLALASCQPELTPGLLRQAMNDVSRTGTLAEEQRQLIALISALDQSNRILETKIQQLEAELERTISGIRDIEADIGGIEQNGSAR